jgi:hypothetical protein
MIKKHEKVVEKPDFEKIKDQGVLVGPSYEFLFEGENEDYDEEYGDYI